MFSGPHCHSCPTARIGISRGTPHSDDMNRTVVSCWRLMLLLAASFQPASRADVATDGSFGPTVVLRGPNFAIPASLGKNPPIPGKKGGENLFHSFADFDLVNGQSATFFGPAGVKNILARVTGGNESSIDGILRSDIDGANLYFINPSGVLFGANSKLEITGSFTVTTADYIRFGDGGRFDAHLPANDVLTSAPVSAFGFLSAVPAAVSFNGSKLDDAIGKSLTVIAGDVSLDQAKIVRTDRPLDLISVRSRGEVRVGTDSARSLDVASFAKLGGVTLKNSSSLEAGRVVIRGGVLSLEKSSIAASGKRAGDRVDASLQREILLADGSAIRSTAAATTPGQSALLLKAPTISISSVSEVVSSPPATESGARDLRIDADGLEVSGGGQILALGGGNVEIHAKGARLLGTSPDFTLASRISTESASGPAGNVRLQLSGKLTIRDGARIETASPDTGGDIFVEAASASIIGASDFRTITGIRYHAFKFFGGNAGSIHLDVSGRLTLANGGQITSESFGRGQVGSIFVKAGSVRIAGKEKSTFSGGISTNIETADNEGSGGEVRLDISGDLEIVKGGQITSQTAASAPGGDITIRAKNVLIVGGGADTDLVPGLNARTVNRQSGGRGGDVRLTITGNLTIAAAGKISADTLGSGDGGGVSLRVGETLRIMDSGLVSALAKDSSSGDGGSVIVKAHEVLVSSGGGISAATSGFGKGGELRMDVAGGLHISDSAQVTASTTASGDGGNIKVRAGELLVSADGVISAATSGSGPGGSIEFSAANLALSGRGSISAASTGAGAGGGIRGSVPGALRITDSGLITASTSLSGLGGNVSLTAGDLFLSTGGKISAATDGTGDGGKIDVMAKTIVILHGVGSAAAIISAESTGKGEGGDGGDVSIDAGSLRIEGAPDFSTGISALSRGAGESGSVRLKLGTLSLDSSAFIGSSNTGEGNAGSVRVRADGDIFMRGGSIISVSAAQANAGTIDIASLTRIDLREGASITASAGLNGGSITVAAPDFIHLIDSSITAKAGAEKLANADGGMGGNITIDPEFMVLDHSVISANAAIGRGGNIFLQADNFLSSETSITATGTTAGTVEIVAPELDLSAALVILRGGLVDPSTQLREQCARRLGLDFSSFLVIGRGGVSLAPDDPLSDLAPGTAKKRASRGEN